MVDPNSIRHYFSVYEGAFLEAFHRLGFDEPGGNHAPSPFLGINKCLGQLVQDDIIADKPVLVLGSGDSRINVALNYHGRDSYGLERDLTTHKMGLLTVKALRGGGLIRPERPIVLSPGDFYEPSSYEGLGLPFEVFHTVYHYDGTGDFHHMEGVAHLVAHESRPGTVLLLAAHNGIPFHFEGLSCNRTYRIWGRPNAVAGMYLHVYKKTMTMQERGLRRKRAHHDAFAVTGPAHRT